MTRSIPAYAGEPPCRYPAATPPLVYPRVCGGTGGDTAAPPEEWGLSPRMRGNRSTRSVWNDRARSIPAYAGEP